LLQIIHLALSCITKTIFALLVVFLLPAAFLSAQQEARADALLAEADALITANNLSGALAKTNQAVSISPNYHPGLQKQINIFFLMNDEKEAIRAVDDALDKYPNIPGYYYLRGIINNSRGKYIRALDDFDRAIELNPADIIYRCYLGRGVSHMNLMEYDQALADFTSSIELNDTVASAYHSRAMVNYELHDYSSAINDFLKTLDLSEGNSALYFNLGMSFYRLNEKAKACPYFHKSCTMGNTNACRMTLMECAKAIPVIP
jgi:tetratricopeptide (TPR) repeat protein